jgi:hypothetical protein
MSFNYIKTSLCFLLASASLFAAKDKPEMEQQNHQQGYSQDNTQMIGAYNAPGRYDIQKSWDWYTSASFIYWQSLAHDLYFATWNNSPVRNAGFNPAQSAHHQMADYKFNFHPGFKFGLGLNTNYDDWNLFLRYTWLHPSSSHISVRDSADVDYLILQGNFDPEHSNSLNRAQAHWKAKLNVLDLELGRSFYVGKNLIFNVNAGPKFYVTHFNEKVYYFTTASDLIFRSYSNKNHEWGIGARLGFESNWLIGAGFRMFGNGSYSLAYQHNKMMYYGMPSSIDTNPTFKFFHYRDSQKSVVGITELALGLGYATYLNHQKYNLDISASYEFQLWTDQISHLAYANVQTNYITSQFTTLGTPYHPTNLMLHGLTMTLRFDF